MNFEYTTASSSWMNIVLFQLEFLLLSLPKILLHILTPTKASFVTKSPVIPLLHLKLNFLLKGHSILKPQIACSRLIVSTSNNKNPVRKRSLAYATNGPILLQLPCLRENCLKSKANKQDLAKQKELALQSLMLVLKKKKWRAISLGGSHFKKSRGGG